MTYNHIKHNWAKSEGSSSITSKVTAFLWKVPKEGYWRYPLQFLVSCNSVKTENDISSSKINIFQRNLDRKCNLTLPKNEKIYKRNWKYEKIPNFSRLPLFSPKNDILGHFGTKFPIWTRSFELILYRVTK